MMALRFHTLWPLVMVLWSLLGGRGVARAGETNSLDAGRLAYERGDFAVAAQVFAAAVSNAPSATAYQNLGNAEWLNGRVAAALLAWERALRIDPWEVRARNNLQFARETAQLESPDLNWGEIAASWLPAHWWAWAACLSFWFAVSLAVLPSVLRWRKSGWQQALMAIGLGVFLLSLPANYGVLTRTKIGVVLQAETALRLTPTLEGEVSTRLAAGEPARVLRAQGRYLLIRTRLASGWVERTAFALIGPE